MTAYSTTTARYLPVINDLNSYITSFNNFLKDEFSIPLFDTSLLEDDSYFHVLNGTWDKLSFSRRCGVGGVYFYFGYSTKDSNKLLVYVGKAWFTTITGQRLLSYFKHAFDESEQIFNMDNEEMFHIETVIRIPLDKTVITWLAPALEEYIIAELRKAKKYHFYYVR